MGDNGRAPHGVFKAFWWKKEGFEATPQILLLIRRSREFSIDLEKATVDAHQKAKRVSIHHCLGRPFMAPSLREDLFRWFCSIRGSVRGRIPLSCLRAQAVKCKAQYLAICLQNGVCTEAPDVEAGSWLSGFRKEKRISFRVPNKRWMFPPPGAAFGGRDCGGS